MHTHLRPTHPHKHTHIHTQQGMKKSYPVAAPNTAEIKAALVAMITRHTGFIPRSKQIASLSDKIADFFGTL